MIDQAFSKPALAKCLCKYDFLKYPRLNDDTYKDKVIDGAREFAKYSVLVEDAFSQKTINKKPVYELKGLEKTLVLRRANQNLRRIYKVKQNDRDLIIKQLISALKDGVEYNIYKLDIEKFYESFDHKYLINIIESNRLISYDTKNFILSLIKSFPNVTNKGLPRGISISATISELAMIEFDTKLKEMDCVYFYFRYVDDIIIITDRKEKSNFIQIVESLLPDGLGFHKKEKRNVLKLNNASDYRDETKKNNKAKVKSIEYLGYKFSIYEPIKKLNPYKYRDIQVDISDSKVKKIKTRILKSFIFYIKNGDFKLLEDRIRFLTSNFRLLDKKKNIYVMSGVFYNYKRVVVETSNAIPDLDRFLRSCIYSSQGISGYSLILTTSQKRKLLKNTFERGFKNRKTVKFSPARQSKIQRTWKNA
ncbi:TPA: antiviral reverse transcriptase Drt3a [Photobacterium damselae]